MGTARNYRYEDYPHDYNYTLDSEPDSEEEFDPELVAAQSHNTFDINPNSPISEEDEEEEIYFDDESRLYDSSGENDVWFAEEPRPELHKRQAQRLPSQVGFSGLGPRSYTRSDYTLKDDVSDELNFSPDVDAREIEVDVIDGVITLTGTVPERWMKYEAEEIAESVRGVQEVKNQIVVDRSNYIG